MKFVIVSPRQNNGGSIVLHALCKYLSEMGHDAKIFCTDVFRYDKRRTWIFWLKWVKHTLKDTCLAIASRIHPDENKYRAYVNPPVKGCKRKYLPWVDDDTIVVYPEIFWGNFLKAKNVVRWFLYHNRYVGNESEAYGENDFFICYREIFNDTKLNPEGRMVQTPYFDLETYQQYNFGERKGTCYIVRKGKGRADLPEEFNGIIVDELNEKQKVEVFNSCEYCISYDTQTAYSGIAAMCGCISIIVPEVGKTRMDYEAEDERIPGVAWGFSEEEIAYSINTRHEIRQNYELNNRKSKDSANAFVKMCEARFTAK